MSEDNTRILNRILPSAKTAIIAVVVIALFLFVPVYLLGIGFVVYLILKTIREYKNYKASTYYQQTQTPYLAVRRDLGKYGEYLTYFRLKNYEKDGGRFLFNVYIPKGVNEATEIDVLLISSKGLFVFESKNYSGWIFGNESQRNWTQTLPLGKGRSNKEHFYNPIMQNRTHIKYLRNLVGEQMPVRSIIVFSERCTLKDVKVKSEDIRVINRYDVAPAVASLWNQMQPEQLSQAEINNLYEKLYSYTQVSQAAKAQHIENIRRIYDV